MSCCQAVSRGLLSLHVPVLEPARPLGGGRSYLPNCAAPEKQGYAQSKHPMHWILWGTSSKNTSKNDPGCEVL